MTLLAGPLAAVNTNHRQLPRPIRRFVEAAIHEDRHLHGSWACWHAYEKFKRRLSRRCGWRANPVDRDLNVFDQATHRYEEALGL